MELATEYGLAQKAIGKRHSAHTRIANLKRTVRREYHGVSNQRLPGYWAEYCHRLQQRLWESQRFKPNDHLPILMAKPCPFCG
jgi:hypothetical protein